MDLKTKPFWGKYLVLKFSNFTDKILNYNNFIVGEFDRVKQSL